MFPSTFFRVFGVIVFICSLCFSLTVIYLDKSPSALLQRVKGLKIESIASTQTLNDVGTMEGIPWQPLVTQETTNAVEWKGNRPAVRIKAAVDVDTMRTMFPTKNGPFKPSTTVGNFVFDFNSITIPAVNAPSGVFTPIDRPTLPHRFPIVLITHDRHVLLYRTLLSLLSLRGINETAVVVSCDGTSPQIKAVVERFKGVNLVQNTDLGNHIPNRNRITLHYKFTLSYMFDQFPASSYIIVVEDDMVFAPDFLDYFASIYRLYEIDDSIYCISSWNDNGFHGLARDASKLLRTEFFVGLGWLASRNLYVSMIVFRVRY